MSMTKENQTGKQPDQRPDSLPDPLSDPACKGPGFFEGLLSAILGSRRPLDCVQIEVTSHCPGRCTYCPHTTMAATWQNRHLDARVMAALWPLLRRTNRAHLQGWGEPLLHPRFADFVKFAARAGCQVSSTTCGLVMNDALADRLAKLGSNAGEPGLDALAFSLAGTSESGNAVRAGVSLAKVREAIAMLNAAKKRLGQGQGEGLQLHLAYLLLADRIGEAAGLPELMAELDVPVAVVSTLDYLAEPTQAGLAIGPNDLDTIAAARQVLEKAAAKAGEAGRSIFYALPRKRDTDPDKASQGMPGGCRENVASSLHVSANGQISPCVYCNVPDGVENPRRLVFGEIICERQDLQGLTDKAEKADKSGQISKINKGENVSKAPDPWQIWKSAEFVRFRQDLVAGKPAPACIDCPKRLEEME